MAERRMLSKKITNDDRFMNLSASAQALYMHLNMNADDDGFCNQVSIQMFRAHASVQDFEALISAKFIYRFESGVVVIKHWRMANTLRKDRNTPTSFKKEFSMLSRDENGAYTMSADGCQVVAEPLPDGCQVVAEPLPDGCQVVAEPLPQIRVDKNRVDKNRVKDTSAKRFTPPTVEEVSAYCQERNNGIDAQHFVDHYSSNGWMVGKNRMKDWKAAVRTWEKNAYGNAPKAETAGNEQRTYGAAYTEEQIAWLNSLRD